MTAIDKALGISPQVLALRAQRMNLLSSNIANADTPGYKRATLILPQPSSRPRRLRERCARPTLRISLSSGSATRPDALYRVPSEVAPDGNSVDPTLEHASFMDNALRYQASLQLLDSRIKGIKNALKGDS